MNKINIKKFSFKDVLKLLWCDKLLLIVTFFLSIIAASSIMTCSIFVGFAIDLFIKFVDLLQNNSTSKNVIDIEALKIIYLSLIIFSLFILYWLSNSSILYFAIKISHRAGSKIRYKIFSKLLSVPIQYIDTNKTGELISKATNDVDNMIFNVTQIMVSCFMSPFIILGSLITAFVYTPILALITIVMISLIFLGCGYISIKASPNYARMQDKIGEMNGFSEEYIENKLPIYLFRRQKLINKKFEKINREYAKESYKAEFKIGMVWPLLDILENIVFGIIYIIGFIFIITEKFVNIGIIPLSIGTLSTFVLLIRLSNGEIGNIARFASIYEKFIVCIKRIMSLLVVDDDKNEGKIKLSKINGEIIFENVYFSYTKNKPIIKNFNLHVKPGQKIAIVGPTGSGKTTIINLLMRFYELDSGKIFIDGQDIKEMDKNNLRKHISIVLQETSLFSESIATNISYGNHDKEIELDKIKHSAKEIGSEHFINQLDDGYNTIIKNTSNLSSGESQLLALTRAHYSPSNILILDEATSSIDSKTERDVQKGMLHLMKGKTTFIIAHRLSTIVNSDLIVVMKNGEIIEKGTHRNLLSNKNFYYNLYNSHSLELDE